MLNTTIFTIKKQLDHLNTLNVITYDRMRDKPQLAFLTPRYDANKLPLNKERLTNRREIQREKLNAMLNYVENNSQCRTGIILEYFGEYNFKDCGHCDHCLEKKHKLSKSDRERIREMVRYELGKGPKFPEELVEIFEDTETVLAEEIIREMTDMNELFYEKTGKLAMRQK